MTKANIQSDKNYSIDSFTDSEIKTKVLDLCKKNMASLSEVQQLMMDNYQMFSKKQGLVLSKLLQDNSSLVGELMKAEDVDKKLLSSGHSTIERYIQSLNDLQEFTGMVNKCNNDLFTVIKKQVNDNLEGFQSYIERNKPDSE